MARSRIQNVEPTEYNNIKFRSKLEYSTAVVFDKIGIKYLYEPYSIELQESFRFRGTLYRKIEYKPDFIIGGNIIIECKGFETPEWKIKRKLLLHHIYTRGGQLYFYEMHTQKELFEILDRHHETFNVCVECSNGTTYNTLKDAIASLRLEKKINSVIRNILGMQKDVNGYTFTYTTEHQDGLSIGVPLKKIIPKEKANEKKFI